MKPSLSFAYMMKKKGKPMASGGQVPQPEARDVDNQAADEEDEMAPGMESHYTDLVDRIMTKRMSEGGRVANDSAPTADFLPAEYDYMVLNDDLHSTYGDGDNSGDDLGNAREDADRRDIVARVMRQRSMKQRNPRPA